MDKFVSKCRNCSSVEIEFRYYASIKDYLVFRHCKCRVNGEPIGWFSCNNGEFNKVILDNINYWNKYNVTNSIL